LEKAEAVTVMKYFLTFILTVSFLYINCTGSTTNSQNTKDSAIDDNIGHRYTLIGDFNGDGQPDTLIESYQHKHTNQEIPKLQIGARLNKEAITKIMAQEPITSLISKNNTISNYLISAEPQQKTYSKAFTAYSTLHFLPKDCQRQSNTQVFQPAKVKSEKIIV
jgi:hypothetical protein